MRIPDSRLGIVLSVVLAAGLIALPRANSETTQESADLAKSITELMANGNYGRCEEALQKASPEIIDETVRQALSEALPKLLEIIRSDLGTEDRKQLQSKIDVCKKLCLFAVKNNPFEKEASELEKIIENINAVRDKTSEQKFGEANELISRFQDVEQGEIAKKERERVQNACVAAIQAASNEPNKDMALKFFDELKRIDPNNPNITKLENNLSKEDGGAQSSNGVNGLLITSLLNFLFTLSAGCILGTLYWRQRRTAIVLESTLNTLYINYSTLYRFYSSCYDSLVKRNTQNVAHQSAEQTPFEANATSNASRASAVKSPDMRERLNALNTLAENAKMEIQELETQFNGLRDDSLQKENDWKERHRNLQQDIEKKFEGLRGDIVTIKEEFDKRVCGLNEEINKMAHDIKTLQKCLKEFMVSEKGLRYMKIEDLLKECNETFNAQTQERLRNNFGTLMLLLGATENTLKEKKELIDAQGAVYAFRRKITHTPIGEMIKISSLFKEGTALQRALDKVLLTVHDADLQELDTSSLDEIFGRLVMAENLTEIPDIDVDTLWAQIENDIIRGWHFVYQAYFDGLLTSEEVQPVTEILKRIDIVPMKIILNSTTSNKPRHEVTGHDSAPPDTPIGAIVKVVRPGFERTDGTVIIPALVVTFMG